MNQDFFRKKEVKKEEVRDYVETPEEYERLVEEIKWKDNELTTKDLNLIHGEVAMFKGNDNLKGDIETIKSGIERSALKNHRIGKALIKFCNDVDNLIYLFDMREEQVENFRNEYYSLFENSIVIMNNLQKEIKRINDLTTPKFFICFT
jgi:uncharacterized coiled-coil DUF342 family protein